MSVSACDIVGDSKAQGSTYVTTHVRGVVELVVDAEDNLRVVLETVVDAEDRGRGIDEDGDPQEDGVI